MAHSFPHQRRPRSVLVVDDQRTFADLLAGALASEPDLDLVGVAYELTRGLELADRHRPDVIVLDIHFQGDTRDGIDVCFELRLRHPACRVVLLSGLSDSTTVGRAAAAGASALLAKNGSLAEVLAAVRTDDRGLQVDRLLLREAVSTGGDRVMPALTPREHDVLRMLALGMDARTIGDHLEITLSTCRSYIKSLLSKLDAHSQLEGVAIARRLGLFGPQGPSSGQDRIGVGAGSGSDGRRGRPVPGNVVSP